MIMYKERLNEYIERLDEEEARDLFMLIELIRQGKRVWEEDPGLAYHQYSKHSRFRIFMSPRRSERGPLPPLIKKLQECSKYQAARSRPLISIESDW